MVWVKAKVETEPVGGAGSDSDSDSDNASDDDMGDVGVMDGPGYSNKDDDDPFAGEEGDDFSSGNYGNDDGSFDASDFADFGVQDAKDRAIKDAFATTTSGKPVGTKSGYLSKASATDEQIAAGYKALGLPDPNSDLASADVEASYGVPVGIASVSGVPADPLSSSKKGLLGLNPQDLLAIENFSYAPPAQTNVSLSRNPKSAITSVSAPTSKETDQLLGIFSQGLPSVSNLDDFDMIADLQTTAPVASTPSSNVVSDFSPTPADQLDAEYDMPAGYFSGLDDLVDDDFAVHRQSSRSRSRGSWHRIHGSGSSGRFRVCDQPADWRSDYNEPSWFDGEAEGKSAVFDGCCYSL